MRSEVAADRISEQQWKQVNEHIASLHKENQRQFRTLEEQLVHLVEQKIDFQLQGDQLPAIRDELTACVSQCNQLQHGRSCERLTFLSRLSLRPSQQ